MMDRVDKLRNDLREVLSEEDLDYGEVVRLANELAKQDPDNVRFSTDAAIVEKLGRELVSRQETAVAELIKNGYDADATEVRLVFENAEEPGGTLFVKDNGHGMTREALIDGFMRLSSRDKVREPKSPKYGRQRAGKKGIGRFAAQRLGDGLTVVTQTEGSAFGHLVEIDWEEFKGGRDLASVANKIGRLSGGRSEGHGTTLQINDLRDGWTEATMRRVYRYVSDLVQPFPLSEEGEDKKTDPGFRVTILRQGEEDYKTVADEKQFVYDNALATIAGEVDEEGQGCWTVESSEVDITHEAVDIGRDRDSPDTPFKQLRDVRFEAYYFVYKAGLIPKLARKKIRTLAQKRGGIRVYRNGFRVLPYGEPGDDWLGLDESARSRGFLPAHSNQNFFGFVEIIDPEGELFEETASREGLINNEAFDELKDFVFRAVLGAVRRVSEARGIKITPGQDDWEAEDTAASEEFRETAERLSEAADAASKETDPEKAEKKLIEAVEEESKRAEKQARLQEEREEAQLKKMEMLRVLASLGTSIAEFVHELRAPLSSARTSAGTLKNSLKEGTPEQEAASDLVDNLDNFKAYASYFDETVSANTQRELRVHNLVTVVEEFVDAAKALVEPTGLEMTTTYENYDLYTVPMHPSEWTSILFNFFSNARKAIRRGKGQGKVDIRVGRDDGRVYIEFADSGEGIPKEDRERIFNPFFTTTGPAPRGVSEAEELRGTGLGLTIVRDIISGYDGEVFLITPPDGFSTCFRVEVPSASDEQVDEYAN